MAFRGVPANRSAPRAARAGLADGTCEPLRGADDSRSHPDGPQSRPRRGGRALDTDTPSRAEASAHVRSRPACSSRHAARETRAITRRSRRPATIRSLPSHSRQPARVFRKLDAVAVLTTRLLPAPRSATLEVERLPRNTLPGPPVPPAGRSGSRSTASRSTMTVRSRPRYGSHPGPAPRTAFSSGTAGTMANGRLVQKNGLRGGLPSPVLPGSGPWGSPFSRSAVRPLSLTSRLRVSPASVRFSSLDHLADDVHAACRR